MAWNGIPFQIFDSLSKDNLVLQVTKLPTLMVDSGFPWENILGSLIAGCIPAFIAWKTIKYNNELIKRQITLAAQQKKCDELRDLFSNYISILEITTEFTNLLYCEYNGDGSKIPFEKIAELKDDFCSLRKILTHISLLIGTNNPYYEALYKLNEDVWGHIEEFFKNFNKQSTLRISLDEYNKKYLDLFNEILEGEQSKI